MRREPRRASGHAREESFDVRAAVSKDGDLLGLDVAMVIDIGAYPVMGTMVAGIVEAMLPGPYKMAALGFESTAVATNKASYIAYRGPWASETFVRERVLDLLARDLGLDPLEIRLRNVAPRTDPPVMMITGHVRLVGLTTRESRLSASPSSRGHRPAFRQPARPKNRCPRTLPPGHRHGDLHRGGSRAAPARRAKRPDGA